MGEGIALWCLGKIGGFAVSCLGQIGGGLVAPIGRQFGYLFHFNRNMENLKTQLEKLETTRQGVQLGVDEASRNVRIIGPDVEAWLTSVDGITAEAEGILQDKTEVQKGWCPNRKSRYSLSKKATKKTQIIVDLQSAGIRFTKLSYSPPPPGMQSIPTREFKGFESRMSTIEALKDDKVNLIAICGMGGIGKTTMMYEVAKRVQEENLFHEVAVTVVKQKPKLTKIQKDIAEMLGLKLEEENPIVRANRLCARLQNNEDKKRILVILDDVWEELNLEDLGIPLLRGNEGCKILYTSRNRDLWNDVQTKRHISLELLSHEEAWQLFREKVGDSADAPELQHIAKDIVNECGCLPLALVAIGSALSKKSKDNFINHVWIDVLQKLRMPCPKSILSGVPANVYKPLELSYTYLEDEEAKSLFLLCCLFEEDCDISIEDLFRYGMGRQMFEGINELWNARHRVFSLVDQLRNCYLLLDSEDHECVKVHDVVRDVGISIASNDKHALVISHDVISEWPKKVTYEHYTSISVISEKITELPEGLRCPNLEFLLLACGNSSLKTPYSYFEGMGELKVLNLRSMFVLSLPPSLQFLRNLRTLCLEECELENIAVIEELLNLEILSFCYSKIKELPKEIGRLVNLKLLDLKYCERLGRISPGVISSLVQLQELYMRRSFSSWEAEEEQEGKVERRNASLRELESLSDLTTLEIEIPDVGLLPRNSKALFGNLTKYTILIGDFNWPIGFQFQKHLELCLGTCIPLGWGINSLLMSTEFLSLEGKGSEDVVRELVRDGVGGLQYLKVLSICHCDTLECLSNTVDWVAQLTPSSSTTVAPVVFPILESLDLQNLPILREICHGQLPAGSLGNLRRVTLYKLPALTHFLWVEGGLTQTPVCLHYLRSIHISFCHKLGNLFPVTIARGLVQLQELFISNCDMMEEVICKERGGDWHEATNKIEFPNLEHMELERLPSLTSFCRGIDQIEFPKLKTLRVGSLAKLESLFTNESNLSLEGKPNAIWKKREQDGQAISKKLEFPKLVYIKLVYLPRLTNFCRGINEIEFPQLKKLYIAGIPKVKCLFPTNLSSEGNHLHSIFPKRLHFLV